MKKLQQFNIMAFQYDRLNNSNFNMTITPKEAFKNDELIALADNECLRKIRKITKHAYNEDILSRLRKDIRYYYRLNNTIENRDKIREINKKVEEQLYIPEFVCVQTPKKANYRKIGKSGFTLNGEKYIRLMCGASHARTNRAMFCQEKIYKELDIFLRCDCKDLEIILAKWNAYYALSSSATNRVTRPRVCVITDKEIKMTKTVDWVTENNYQDTVERCDKELDFNLFDGMGLISPTFAEQWACDLELDYLPSAFCIRNAFIKGLVCVFDFNKFGSEVANNTLLTDIYGKTYKHNDIDIILTESQFKLWKHYDSWQDYNDINIELGWEWGISKVSPKADNDYIRTNYQYLQVLNLSDKDLVDLCKPTVDWIKGVCGNDVDKMVLYLMGKISSQDNSIKAWNNIQDSFLKSLMAEKCLKDDTYIRNRIVNSINKRIRESYMGKLIIKGNYQFIYGDPYALCEHAFGLEVKGLLNEFEHYSNYWNRKSVDTIVAMRSPLTWNAEVNQLNLKNNDRHKEWYRYMTSGIILPIGGNDNMLFSGADHDGDGVISTDNEIFLRCRSGGVPVAYAPKKANKELIER